MRLFLRRRAAGFFLAAFLLFWVNISCAAISPLPDHITLTWTDNPQTTQTITWRTDSSVAGGLVRFAEATEPSRPLTGARQMAATAKTLETNAGVVQVFTATLTGLIPGKSYDYQVGSTTDWSEVFRFQTEPRQARSFSFLVLGDSQSLDYGVWRRTLQQAVKTRSDARFFVNMGDLVDVGQDYTEWEAWFAGTAGVGESLPAMPLTGNHECYTPERRFSRPVYFTSQFFLPQNGPEGLEGQVYSFDYGDAHLVMLDSQQGEQARFLPDLLERQRLWLEQDLAATNKKWKLVFMHRPIYGNKSDGVNEKLRLAFEPLFDRFQVDVVFTAHDHVVARTLPLFGGEAAKQPLRGTVHAATGRTGTKTYSNVSANSWNAFFYNPVDEPNYLVVTVNAGGSLRVEAFRRNGELLDQWGLEK